MLFIGANPETIISEEAIYNSSYRVTYFNTLSAL